MLAALRTQIASCSTDQVRFFSMTRFLSFGEVCFFSIRDRPFFLVMALLFGDTLLVFCGEAVPTCDTRAAGCQLVLHGAGLEITLLCFELNVQFQALVDSKMVLLPSIQSIPTASAVRCYTAMQAFERLLWFPLVLSVISLCLLLRMWCSGDRPKNRCSTLTLLLIDCTIRTLAPPCLSVDEHSMLSCSVCCMEWPID